MVTIADGARRAQPTHLTGRADGGSSLRKGEAHHQLPEADTGNSWVDFGRGRNDTPSDILDH